ncbi:MAG: InlB B-repeat-containing protein, partial [Spirochaetia bacterium]|nr:InlB B-repeat-containing protein [Spirochaetia bacterium]
VSILLIFSIILLATGCGGGGGGGAAAGDGFAVNYIVNGAESGAGPVGQYSHGEEVTISDNTGNLAKAGYLFDGWNTKADGTGKDYAPGAKYKGDELFLYAKWAPIYLYDIVDVGLPAPALDGIQRSPGEGVLSIRGLAPAGTRLSVFNIPSAIDGITVKYIASAAFQNNINMISVTLPETLAVIGGSSFQGCINLTSLVMLGTTPPTLAGGALDGCPVTISVPVSAVDTYKAEGGWDAYSASIFGYTDAPHTVTFDSQGATTPASPASMTVNPPSVIVGTLPTPPQKTGYNFGGWFTGTGGTGTEFTATTPFTINLTVYAYWEEYSYTVAFDDQGATTPVSPDSKTVNSPATTIDALPTAPAKNGQIFAGWYTQTGGGGTQFTASTPVTGNITVYAYWVDYSYTVSFDDQGATTHVTPSTKTVNSPATTVGSLPTAPEKTNFAFGGWYTQTGGAGDEFTAGTTVTGDITVYAKWNPVYTVTFNDQGATTHVTPSTKTVTYPATTVGSLPTPPEKTFCTFGGWYTQTGGAGDEFTAGTTVTGNITVYAKWTFTPVYTEKNNLAVGDIVLQNGKYVSYSNFTAAPSEYMAVSQPAGIVAYFGETGTAGITDKVYMVSLRPSDNCLRWIPYSESSTGYTTTFSTSETSGEGNWAVIQSEDPVDSANAATNYPAFNYANNYSVTGYTTGWFIPSRYELHTLYANKATINDSITTITDAGGTATPMADFFWSSSQNPDYYYIVFTYNFSNGMEGYPAKYDYQTRVRVVRALD